MAATPSPRAPSRHPGAVRAWLVWWALLAALWLALVDTVVVAELVAGAVAAAIAATGAVLVRGRREIIVRPRAAWLPAAVPALLRFGPDLLKLASALWRRGVRRGAERGRLVEVPYGAVGNDPEAAAHRVLTEALGSFAPNSIVVDIDRDRRVVLVHELVPTDDPAAAAKPLPEP
jgi:multisubunit Na+/H+ antiporter MnhE subunit